MLMEPEKQVPHAQALCRGGGIDKSEVSYYGLL